MNAPRKLSISPVSPNYDKEAIKRVDKVFVDDVHIENCVAYDMDAGWALPMDGKTRLWKPKVYGVVKVTMR